MIWEDNGVDLLHIHANTLIIVKGKFGKIMVLIFWIHAHRFITLKGKLEDKTI